MGRLIAVVRRRAAAEDGVALVVVSIMLVALLACAALAIDVGSFYQAQRQAQSAADAAALAASQNLPDFGAQAQTVATTFAQQNDPTATVVATTPYNGDATRVKVSVSASTPSFFGQLLGLTSARVSATATASANLNQVHAAIFAYSNADLTNGSVNCDDGVTVTGNSANVTGGIVSNGSISVNSNPNSNLSGGWYGNGCTATVNPTGAFQYGPYQSPPRPYPIDYRTQTLPACTVTYSGAYSLSSVTSGTSTTPMVYCDPTGTLTLSGNNNNCSGSNVMFIAQAIIVGAEHCTLSAPMTDPSTYGLLLYATGTTNPGIQVTANNTTLNGTEFAPSSEIQYTGNSGGTGFLEGESVDLGGNSATVISDGPIVGSMNDSLTG